MVAAGQPEKTSVFRGWAQPDPEERLIQAKIFLADEDYYRTLNFQQKLADIEAYVAFLRENDYDGNVQLLKQICDMIGVHKDWIKKATQTPSTSFLFAQYTHKNRLIGLVKNKKRRADIEGVTATKIPEDLIPGPAIHKCIDKGDRPISPDPFLYTKQLAEVRRRQDAEAERVLEKELEAIWRVAVPTNFNGPYTPTVNISYEKIIERRNLLSEILKNLKEGGKLAPRPFIHEIISIITDSEHDGMVKVQAELLDLADQMLTNEDLRQLLILTEPSSSSHVRSTLPDLSNNGSPQSALFTQIVDGLFQSDLWRGQGNVASLKDIHRRINSKLAVDRQSQPLTLTVVESVLKEMNEINGIRYDSETQTAQKPVFDRHPEDRFGDQDSPAKELFIKAAYRFGYAMAHLGYLLSGGSSMGYGYAPRDIFSLSSIKEKVEAKFPLPGFVTPLLDPQISTPPQRRAVELLQRQIMIENHRNWDTRTPNFSKLWAFGADVEKPKQFFSLHRWPPELQTQERYHEIKQGGPTPPSPKSTQNMERDTPRPKPGETFYPGETFFPFGETPIQQAILNQQIEKDLANVPEFAHLYTTNEKGEKVVKRVLNAADPFALPEIPECESTSSFGWAQEVLGEGLRDEHSVLKIRESGPTAPLDLAPVCLSKRKREEDNGASIDRNPLPLISIDPTVILADSTAEITIDNTLYVMGGSEVAPIARTKARMAAARGVKEVRFDGQVGMTGRWEGHGSEGSDSQGDGTESGHSGWRRRPRSGSSKSSTTDSGFLGSE